MPVTIALPATWTLITNKDVHDVLYSLSDLGKVDEIVLLLNKLSPNRKEDSELKNLFYRDLPWWLKHHVLWPIGEERYSDVLFYYRAFNAFEVDVFIADKETDITNAGSAIQLNRKPPWLSKLLIRDLDRLDRYATSLPRSYNFKPLDSALDKVL